MIVMQVAKTASAGGLLQVAEKKLSAERSGEMLQI